MLEASQWWRSLLAEAPGGGAGLVAFGSFAFDPTSPRGGVLMVPEVARAVGSTRELVSRTGPGDYPAGVRVEDGDMSRAAYMEAVAMIRDAIRAGRLEKAVLARDVVLRAPEPVDRAALLGRLAAAHPDVALFAVDGLIGASPETLVTVHGGRVTARVLAGTAGPGEAEALADSDKDGREHELARRSVLEALAPHVTNLEVSATPFVLELPHLTHLATDVSGTIADGSDVLSLVAALHPTAAVAGTPRSDAIASIRQVETFDRGRYSGPVGWVDANGDGEWAIALRCAEFVDDRTARACTGAGIMSDSIPEMELAETDLKLRPILEAFGLKR